MGKSSRTTSCSRFRSMVHSFSETRTPIVGCTYTSSTTFLPIFATRKTTLFLVALFLDPKSLSISTLSSFLRYITCRPYNEKDYIYTMHRLNNASRTLGLSLHLQQRIRQVWQAWQAWLDTKESTGAGFTVDYLVDIGRATGVETRRGNA